MSPPFGLRSLLDTSAGWASALPLSPRECEIARLVACDLTNKEIAAVLEISEWTVSTHLRRMFCKLEVHTRAGMVARVLDVVAAADPRFSTALWPDAPLAGKASGAPRPL